MKNKYKFSVIIPVYNVEKYLDETVGSVINQTIGFEDNIQLILVNDGSKDSSAEICKKYRDMYPENIIFVDKENGGTSSARNAGIKYIEGKYVNFLDSDDKWDINAFSTAYDYFEKHYDEIDMLVCRTKLFEAKSGFHGLDYKFNAGTRIVDITDPAELFSIQLINSPVIIKAEAITENVRFDLRLNHGEDSVFNNKLMLEKCRYGLLKEALFYYRKRLSQNSEVDKMALEKFYYTDMLEYYHKELFAYSKQKCGEILPFIKAVVVCDLLWRFDRSEIQSVLTAEEFEAFKKTCADLLQQVDDSIIFGLPVHKTYTRRSAAVNFKYGIDYYKSLTLKESELYYRDFRVFNFASRNTLCVLNSLGADNNKIRVEVLIASWLLRSTATGGKLVLKVGERFVNPKEILEYAPKTANTVDGGEYYFTSCVFNLKLKLKEGEAVEIAPYIVYGDNTVPICLNCAKAQGVSPSATCRLQGKYAVSYADDAIKISRK